tara:strand:- start:9019 stop:10317 length:1299 start_codon:yes stop_codon:yes gene_type:complete
MAVYKGISDADVQTSRSSLNQLIDIVQADISGSTTRQKFQVFVTGGIGPGVTSSLFQTVYDQNYSLQTANPILDMTYGVFSGSEVVASCSLGSDANGKLLFPSSSLMMREKINIYRQFSQLLNGNATGRFYSPYGSSDNQDAIDTALFINFKRLFARDAVKRETFAMQFFSSGAAVKDPTGRDSAARKAQSPFGGGAYVYTNTNITSTGSAMLITDIGAAANLQNNVYGGSVGKLVDSANTANNVGLIFYDDGIVVLNLQKVMSASQFVTGVIDAMTTATTARADGDTSIAAGKTVIGSSAQNPNAMFIPDFVNSASIDNIIDHIAMCRFQSGSAKTAATFQNQTNINSTLIFCRAGAGDFNYSSNPTFTDSSNNITVISQDNPGQNERTFTMPTTIGLYDSAENLLAVAKLSRPIEKNDQKDIVFRVRLDF